MDFNVHIDDLKNSLTKIGSHASKVAAGVGDTIQKASKVALTAITASATALSGLGLAAFNEGKKFESAFAGVKKTVDATKEQFKELKEGIMGLSERMPESASDIAGVAEAAGQLGIATDDILSFSETMIKLGTATNLTSEEAATQLAKFANITKMSADDYERLGSTIVALGNNFATTEADIVAMAMRMASTGEIVGLTESEIMAVATALNSLGIEAEAGGSAISKAMKQIEVSVKTGNGNLENYAAVAGMTVETFSNLWQNSPVEALDAFVTGLNDVERNGMSAIEILDEMDIKEIRLSNALLSLSSSGGLLTKAVNLSNQAWEENNALNKEAEQRYETLDSKIDMLKSSTQNLGIIVYEGMEMPLKSAAEKGIQYVSELQAAFKADGMKGLVQEFSNIFVEILTFGAEKAPDFFKMGSDFLLSIADGLKSNSDKIGTALTDVIIQLPDFIVSNFNAILSVGSALIDKLTQGISANADKIGGAAATLMVRFADFLIVNIPKLAKAAVQIVSSFAKELGRQVPLLKPFTLLLQGVSKIISKFGDKIVIAVTAVLAFKKISSVIGVISKFKTVVKEAGGAANLFKGFLNNLGSPISLAVTAIGALTTSILGYVEAVETSNRLKMDEFLGEYSRATDDYRNKIDNLSESLTDAHKATEKQIEANDQEIEKTKSLVAELNNYVDANGNVKSGYEDRVNYILGELASATGEEISQIEDGSIPAYEDLADSIDKALEKKKALAQLDAFSDEADTAHDTIREYSGTKTGLEGQKQELEKELEEVRQGFIREYAGTDMESKVKNTPFDLEHEEFWKSISSSGVDRSLYSREEGTLGLAVQLDEVTTSLAELEAETDKAIHTWERYNEAEELASKGDFEGASKKLELMLDVNDQILSDEQTKSEEKKKILQDELQAEYILLTKAVQDGSEYTAKETSKRMAELIARMSEYGIDSADEFALEFLAGLAEMDGFDTAELMKFIGQSGTDGGKLYGKYCMDAVHNSSFAAKIRDELDSADYEGAGTAGGIAFGVGLVAGLGPHIASAQGMVAELNDSISGTFGAISSLTTKIEMAAFKARQIAAEGGGGGSTTNTTYNNTYNGLTISAKGAVQQGTAYKKSVKSGMGG